MTLSRLQWPVAEFIARQGTEIGVSDWIHITQSRIDDFARVTLDEQYIHVDPERAKVTPFGGTIAHGFLILSLLSAMAYLATPAIENENAGINYGFGNVRFLAPVRSGGRVRGRFTLKAISQKRAGQWLMTFEVSIEIQNEEKPALVAEWMTMSVV